MITVHHHFAGIRIKCPTSHSHSGSHQQPLRPLLTNSYSNRVGAVQAEKEELKYSGGAGDGIVLVNPKPHNGLASKAIDFVESVIVKFMYNSSLPLHYLSGNFAPVPYETPPTTNLHVIGYLPVSFFQ